jgi:hypothetical protein
MLAQAENERVQSLLDNQMRSCSIEKPGRIAMAHGKLLTLIGSFSAAWLAATSADAGLITAADGQRIGLSSAVTVGPSPLILPFNLGELNTPGTSLNQAWQTGLCNIDGSLLSLNPSMSGVLAVGELLVNGGVVTTFQQSIAAGGRDQIPFSAVVSLNAGDQVQVRMSKVGSGTLFLDGGGGGGSKYNMTGANTINGTSAADGQRIGLSNAVTVGPSPVILPFNSGELNTPGTSLNQAWQTGLYNIDGSLLALNTSATDVLAIGELLVNGSVVATFQQSITAGGRDQIPFSAVVSLNAGDQVQVRMSKSGAGTLFLDGGAGGGSRYSLTGANTINGTSAADGQRIGLSNAVTVGPSPLILPFNLGELNTPGTSLNQAWQTGLYNIDGSLLGLNPSTSDVLAIGELLITAAWWPDSRRVSPPADGTRFLFQPW